MAEKKIEDFKGGLNTSLSGYIKDNQFSIAKNVYYNKDKQIETRRGFRKFGSSIGTSPITSQFFFQKDDGTGSMLICASGTQMYEYNPLSTSWMSIKVGLREYETNLLYTANRTRRDFTVYKNTIYMGNGVDSYSSYAGITPAYLTGGTSATSVLATWIAVTNGSFSITIDGVLRNVTGLDFSGIASMNGVALVIQNGIRALTGGLETVTWNTNQFIVSSVLKTMSSSITVTSATGVGTDISGVGATAFMDAETGRGVVTNVVNTFTEYASQPKVRYVSQLTDRIFGAGDDTNPNTLYYTAAAPTNGNTINTNLVVVGGDENGVINGLGELGQVILTFKSNKVYSIDVSTPSALPIDSQSGGYGDRSVNNVGNSIVFFNERGIDTLQQRTGATGSQALESKPLSDDLRALIDQIEEKQYNSCVGWYIKKYNNYYFSFDTNNDNVPDTTLVYNSLVGAWTQYTLPNLYDYGFYINQDQEHQYLFSSANTGQMYEFEYGYDDDGVDIEYEIQSKRFDMDSPGKIKTFEYIDIIGQKSEGTVINANVLIEDIIAGGGEITDQNIQLNSISSSLSLTPISTEPIGATSSDEDISMYRFTIRIPLFQSGMDVAFNLSSTGGQWILEKARIGVDGEPIDVFYSSQIL